MLPALSALRPPLPKIGVANLALHLVAVAVLAVVLAQGSTDMNHVSAFDPMLESGKWAVRFLLLCLAMTPLQTFLAWSNAARLRKPTGLWSFAFALLHVTFYAFDSPYPWIDLVSRPFLLLGVLGLFILTALAATSNRWSMRRLGKAWKRLHRLVYGGAVSVCVHAILATAASKRIYLRDPQAIHELRIYLALIVLLLLVRTPWLRSRLKQAPARRRQGQLKLRTIPVPDPVPDAWAPVRQIPVAPVQTPSEITPLPGEGEKTPMP